METLPLRDIHLPGAVSGWPLAPGWWFLILLAGVLAGLLWVRWRRGLVRRRALAELDHIRARFERHGDDRTLVRDVSTLLRRVCLTYFPRTEVASLTGKSWRDVLRDLVEARHALPDRVAWQIVHAPYNPAEPVEAQAVLTHTQRFLAALPGRKAAA